MVYFSCGYKHTLWWAYSLTDSLFKCLDVTGFGPRSGQADIEWWMQVAKHVKSPSEWFSESNWLTLSA